jgi:hypothetical protein
MKLFNWDINVKKHSPIQVKEAPGAQINKNTYKNFVVKAIGFIASQGAARGDFVDPEYNLEEIKLAADSDSYIKMSLMKYSYLMYKAGYELKGENEKALEYLKMRFRMMSFATAKPVDITFQEVADDLVKYSNAFLVKSRVDKLMPGVQAKGVFNDKPIGGYYRIDPATVKISRDKNGTIKKYQQNTDAGTKDFQPTEIIHFYLDKDANNAFGTPRIVAALEDVKILRRIEGNVISLIYRFAIPIYQWVVGIPEQGFQATDREIEDTQKEIENMPLDGVIVTNEKTSIKAIGAEGSALDASKYLTYFEHRVFAALGVSESQMGRGGAKQDADSMEAQIHDTVKHIQRTMSIFIENMVLNELLLEGGFNPIFNEDDIVTYIFHEISLETKIKLENHEMLKYQSNLNTIDEARIAMGKGTLADEERLYARLIDNKSAIDQINAKTEGSLEIAKVASANKVAGAAGNGTTVTPKANGASTNNNRPTNQFGTGSVKIKSSADEDMNLNITEAMIAEEKTKTLKNHKKTYSSVYKKYENLRNDIAETNSDLDTLFSIIKTSVMTDMKMYIQMSSYEGTQKAVQEISSMDKEHRLIPNNQIVLDQFLDDAEKIIVDLFKDIKKKVVEDRDRKNVEAVFSSFEYRLRYMLEFIIPKVYWFSFVKTGAAMGMSKAYIKFNGSKDAEDHPSVINTKALNIDDIPAYHSFCDCKVSFKAGDK